MAPWSSSGSQSRQNLHLSLLSKIPESRQAEKVTRDAGLNSCAEQTRARAAGRCLQSLAKALWLVRIATIGEIFNSALAC
jgi:hypothetical protein